MEEESEKFCLRWDEFEQNIIGAFKDLRNDKDFYDVTLVCGEKQVQAHRVVLAACSPTFREMISRSPHHHPVLYLRGIRPNDLVAMLDFMYHGEVMIATEELETFLSTAQDLCVRGLTQSGGEGSGEEREARNVEEALNEDVENLLRRLEGGEPPEKTRKLDSRSKINVKKEPGVSSELVLPASITKLRIKQEPSVKNSKPNPPSPPEDSVVLERVDGPVEPTANDGNYEYPSGSTRDDYYDQYREPAGSQAPSEQNYPGLNISTVTERQSEETPDISKQTYPRLDISTVTPPVKTMTGHNYPGINVSTVAAKQSELSGQSLSVSQQSEATVRQQVGGENYVNNSTAPSIQTYRNLNTPPALIQNNSKRNLTSAQNHQSLTSSTITSHQANLVSAASGSNYKTNPPAGAPDQNYSNTSSDNVTSRALSYLRSGQFSQNATSSSTPASYSAQTKQPSSNAASGASNVSSNATFVASIAALGASNAAHGTSNASQEASNSAPLGAALVRTSTDDIVAKAFDFAQLGTSFDFGTGTNAMSVSSSPHSPSPRTMMSPSLHSARIAQSSSRAAQKPPAELFNPRPTYTLAYDHETRPQSETEHDSQSSESEGLSDPESYLEKVQTPEGPKLRCRVCQKMGSSKGKAQLITHVESVHLNSSVECNVCNKTFKAKSYLNKHLKRGKCCSNIINSLSGMFNN